MGLDRGKRGRGPVVVKTVAATIAIVICSSLDPQPLDGGGQRWGRPESDGPGPVCRTDASELKKKRI